MILPSGTQYDLVHGDQVATVTEVGATLRAYTVGERAVLDGFGSDDMCSAGRGQALMPWPNRLADGRYEFDGEEHQAALTQVGEGNAIHGLVQWLPWRAAEHDGDRVAMALTLHPQPGYPFPLELRVEYGLHDAGLTCTTTATNAGDRRCLFGAGFHPYLATSADTVDDTVLTVPASTRLVNDDRGIPSGSEDVEGTDFDFRSPRRVGRSELDTGYTDLVGREVLLDSGDGSSATTLWVDDAWPFLMVFTGDTLGPDERRRGLAVEPMTCAPNAFQSGDGLLVLEPGEAFTGTWGIRPS